MTSYGDGNFHLIGRVDGTASGTVCDPVSLRRTRQLGGTTLWIRHRPKSSVTLTSYLVTKGTKMIEPLNTPKILLSESQIQRVASKQMLVRDFERSGLSIRAFAKARNIPPSSLSRDLRLARMGVTGLIDRRSTSSGRKSEIEDGAIAWTVSFLALHSGAKVKVAWRELKEAAARLYWPYPSYGQLLRAYNNLPHDVRTALFESSRAHFEEWGIVARHQKAAPNQCWQIDVSEFPVWTLDLVTGQYFKPWVIGIIDDCSRVVPFAKFVRNTPSTADVLVAIRSAILPKEDDRFPFFGVPLEIQSDNGSIFISTDYLDALVRLEVERSWIPVDCPSADGKIERWFRTCKTQMAAKMIGYSKQHNALKKAKKGAIPWPLMQGLLEKYLVEYHITKHSSIGTTPWEAWHDRLADAHGFDFDTEHVIDACKIRKDVKVQRDGIELLPRRHYHAPELAGLVDETITLRLPPEGPGKSVSAYYKGEFLAELRCSEASPELAGQIRQARHDRLIELQHLRENLIATAKTILPQPPLATADGLPRPEQAPDASATSDPEITEIPKLESGDEPS